MAFFLRAVFPLIRGQRPSVTLRITGRTHDLASRELHITPLVNDLLAWVLAQEGRLIASRRRLPIGTSLLVIAREDSA